MPISMQTTATSESTNGTSTERHPFRVALLLAFLTALNVLNFIDRFLLQGFAVDLTTELHLSNVQFALLTGFAFTTFYTLAGLAMGALADRLHRPRLMAVGLFAWSALTAVTGVAGNFVQFGLIRMFTGVGEATLTPAALGLLADVFDRKKRAFAAGCYYLGSPIGIGSAFIIAGTFGHTVGWRHCFLALGIIGVFLSLGLLFLRETRVATTATSHASPFSSRVILLDIRQALNSSPALRFLILGGVLVIFAQGTLVLDQLWLVRERGFDAASAQKISGLMFLIGGVLGAVMGGIGADWMQARYANGRLRFLTIVYGIGMPASLFYRFVAPNSTMFYVCMLIGSIVITIGYGPIFACLQDLVTERLRSTMTAFLILCMTLLGTSPGNLMVGWLADTFAAYGWKQPITIAVTLGLIPWLLAICCLHLASKRMRSSALVTSSFTAELPEQ